jgi:hypothetical protein
MICSTEMQPPALQKRSGKHLHHPGQAAVSISNSDARKHVISVTADSMITPALQERVTKE